MRPRFAFTTAAIILFLAQSVTLAQVRENYGIKIGAVGANETWTGFASNWNMKNRWGFTADAYAEIPFFRSFSAQGEIQYTQKGMKVSVPITTVSQPDGTGQYRTISPRIDYVSIPLLAKLKIPLTSLTPYILVGPRFDILISREPDGLDAVVNNFDKMDYGLTVGAGIELDSLFPFGILAEFRYNPNAYDSYQSGYQTIRNRSVDFLVGVRL